jgi:hypothetical protein
MSTILYTAPRFDLTRTEQNRTGRSRQGSARAFWSAAAAVRAFCSALCGGLAAYRQYEHLRSQGATLDAALRTALLHQPLDVNKKQAGQQW